MTGKDKLMLNLEGWKHLHGQEEGGSSYQVIERTHIKSQQRE